MDRRRVIIIGGGASGVLLAAHLLRDSATTRVVIVERRPELGAGVAYGTAHPSHLLNVRAANMSAFPDQPDHFCRWLIASGAAQDPALADPRCFAPRRVYRDYLTSLVGPHLAEGSGPVQLSIVQREAMRLNPTGSAVEAILDDGSSIVGHVAVLATGNEGPPLQPAPWRRDGWTDNDRPISPDARVVIVGAGLTMVDQILTLLHGGHRGPIWVISRHGLTPNPHTDATVLQLDAADLPMGTRLSYLTRKLRELVLWANGEGRDWRSVIDGLRPHTGALWRSLPTDAKHRFLRHARAYWDVHRHRVAPEAYRELLAGRASGQLAIIAGVVVRYEPRHRGVLVLHRRRGACTGDAIEADVVIECRGRATDVAQTANPVLRALLADGQARPDATGLGLDVTDDCEVIGASGAASPRLFAIGPITSGVFWESTAVPDIRIQAAKLAKVLRG